MLVAVSRRLLWINPVGISSYDAPISGALCEEAFPDTRIDACSLKGVKMQHLESNAYVAFMTLSYVPQERSPRGWRLLHPLKHRFISLIPSVNEYQFSLDFRK